MAGFFYAQNSVFLDTQTIPNGNHQKPTLLFGLCGFGRFSNCRCQRHSGLVGQKGLHPSKGPSYKLVRAYFKPYSIVGRPVVVFHLRERA